MPVYVRGLHELQAGLAHADKQVRVGVRRELRHAAEPVQRGAEELAVANIRRVGPRWSKMRIGITRDLVYVAPRQRGAQGRGNQRLRRPNMGTLLMDRAMQPALDQHTAEIETAMEEFLDRVTDQFNRGA